MAGKRTASQRGLGRAGCRLWDAVNKAYELDEHETALLREACRTVDLLAAELRELGPNHAVNPQLANGATARASVA